MKFVALLVGLAGLAVAAATVGLINHYGINLGDPGHRAQLRELMREFLGLAEEG